MHAGAMALAALDQFPRVVARPVDDHDDDSGLARYREIRSGSGSQGRAYRSRARWPGFVVVALRTTPGDHSGASADRFRQTKDDVDMVDGAVVDDRNRQVIHGAAVERRVSDAATLPVRVGHANDEARRSDSPCHRVFGPRRGHAGINGKRAAAPAQSEDALDRRAIHPAG